MDNVKIGDTIKITYMEGEPQYTDREGVVTPIDDEDQIHGTWGGCAIIPEVDTYIIMKMLITICKFTFMKSKPLRIHSKKPMRFFSISHRLFIELFFMVLRNCFLIFLLLPRTI